MSTADTELSSHDLLRAVYVPTMLLALGQGALLATLPLYADQLGVGYTMISLISAAAALGTLVTDVPAGVILHRLGLRPSMLMGCLLVLIGTLSLAIDMPPGMIVSMRLLAGIGTAMWSVSRHAFIATAVPVERRGKALSMFGGIMRIGMFGGPALGGAIATAFELQASFILTGLMAALAFAAAYMWVPATGQSDEVRAGRSGDRWRIVSERVHTHWKDLSAAGLAMVFAQLIRNGRQLLIPLYASTVIGLNPAKVGLVLTISSVIDMVMFVPAGYVMDNWGRKYASVPSFFIMAIGLGLVPFTHSFESLAAVGVLIGFGNGMGSGAMMTLGADLAPPGATGEFLGVWRFVQDCGVAVAPLMVGAVASSLSLRDSAYALAIAGFISSFILLFLVQETRVASAPASGA